MQAAVMAQKFFISQETAMAHGGHLKLVKTYLRLLDCRIVAQNLMIG
jgi:hypothetical protein